MGRNIDGVCCGQKIEVRATGGQKDSQSLSESSRGECLALRAPNGEDLAPNSDVTIYPWKDTQEHINEVIEHTRSFLKQHAATS